MDKVISYKQVVGLVKKEVLYVCTRKDGILISSPEWWDLIPKFTKENYKLSRDSRGWWVEDLIESRHAGRKVYLFDDALPCAWSIARAILEREVDVANLAGKGEDNVFFLTAKDAEEFIENNW